MRNRPGLAMVAAIFAMVIVGLLAASVFTITNADTQTTRSREDAAAALRIAQSGTTHALSVFRKQLPDTSFNRLLRGFDNNAASTADNGLLIGYPGLGDSVSIPAAGRAAPGGTYFVQVLDDPNDGDSDLFNDTNRRIVLRCTGVTATGARAVIDVVVLYQPPLPGVVFDGNVTISGNPVISGQCGDIHVNGSIQVSGTTRVNSLLTVYGSASVGGAVLNGAGQNIGATLVAAPVPVPTMSIDDYCGTADFVMNHDGTVYKRSTGQTLAYNSSGNYSGINGWKTGNPGSSEVMWESTSDNITAGSYCFARSSTGRGVYVKLSNNPGSASTPLSLSIFSSGAIEIPGNPYLTPAHPSGVLLLAEGDLKINGNPSSTTAVNFGGIIYGGSNCEISGTPNITGSYLCKSGPNPPGSKDIVSENKISGDAKITSTCNSSSAANRYRILSWYQRLS